MDIQQSNDGGLRELALFAGAGGGILGGKLLGWRTICAVEREAYAAQVLAQRQNDGSLEPFPIWSDVTSFDGRPWRGRVDVVSGGFPCQDISIAGKGAGIAGSLRSILWEHQARIVGEVRPRYTYVENSPEITHRGLDVIICDLAKMGYSARWGCISGRDCGAVHQRDRFWLLATDDSQSGTQRYVDQEIQRFAPFPWGKDVRGPEDLRNRPGIPQPLIRGNSDGVAFGVDRISAIGNGQIPRVAATAFNLLS